MYERAKDQDIPADPKGFLPIIWGNKRFVISAEIQTTYNKKNYLLHSHHGYNMMKIFMLIYKLIIFKILGTH